MNIAYKHTKFISSEQLQKLFSHTDWEYEKKHAALIASALTLSSNVVSAWDGDILVGLIRSMDDGIWSANIDCLVVHEEYRNQGIGSELLRILLNRIQTATYVNVAPNEHTVVSFYEKNGFTLIEDGRLCQIDRSRL